MASDVKYRVWYGPGASFDDLQQAIDTLTFELNRQLDVDVEVTTGGFVDLKSTPYDTYQEYFDNFEFEAPLQDGVINMLIYRYPIENRIPFPLSLDDVETGPSEKIESGVELSEGSTSDTPVAGYYDDPLSPDTPTMAIVNADFRKKFADNYFNNFVLHEGLHPILDEDNAPECGNEHSFGSQTSAGNSPMLTGYADRVSNLFGNPKPNIICNSSSPSQTINVTTNLSTCTQLEAERYVRENL